MLDSRIYTFLAVCDTLSFTKAAQQLHITQPAVTQQVQFLERLYGRKLFCYSGRNLSKTDKGLLLEKYARTMVHNENALTGAMLRQPLQVLTLSVGATKTIGECWLAPMAERYLRHENRNLSLRVDNTQVLLHALTHGQLDLVLIEGYFEKESFACTLLQEEAFVGICAKDHPFAGKTLPMEALFAERPFVREGGSGTREILENALYEQGFGVDAFAQMTEISNFAVLMHLVGAQLGISFVYAAVAAQSDKVACFFVQGTPLHHAWHAVYLQHSVLRPEIERFLHHI